jgi:hypothetical protein
MVLACAVTFDPCSPETPGGVKAERCSTTPSSRATEPTSAWPWCRTVTDQDLSDLVEFLKIL